MGGFCLCGKRCGGHGALGDCGIVGRCPVTHLYHLRRASVRATEDERTQRANIGGRFSRPSPSSSLPPSLSFRFHSPPRLLRRKQQFTSFIRRHERMKNGGALSLSLFSPSSLAPLTLPPADAAVYEALRMRGHLLRALGDGGRRTEGRTEL